MKKITVGLIALMFLLTTATACTTKPSENESSAASSDISNVIFDTSSASSDESSNASSDISSDVSSDISDTSSGNTYIPPVDDEPEFVDVTSISFESAEINIPIGTMMPIVVNVGPEEATNKDYTLTSSDESILIVMLTNVMGLDNGTVTLTATSVSNPEISATCTVIVGEGSGTDKDDESDIPSDTPSDPPSHTCSFVKGKTTAPTCTEKGFTVYTCSCGKSEKRDYTSTLEHSWSDWETIKEPTTTSTGVEQRYCTRSGCDASETRVLDKLPSDEDNYNVPATAENAHLVEERVLYYLNQYRIAEGTPEATFLWEGKTYKYAKARAEQLVTNFAHDMDDIRAVATELQFGHYVEAYPISYIDPDTGEVVYTGEMTEPYYSPGCSEAITGPYGSYSSVDVLARKVASAIYSSKTHWSYVGAETTKHITVGCYTRGVGEFASWYFCIATSSSDQYD